MKKTDFKAYFKGRKITVMGLGLLGRGVGDTEFLAESGADLIVTDLKKESELKESVLRLKKHKNITFVLGEHRLIDFTNRDFILKAAGVPLDSPYLEEAKRQHIPIEMSASLFAKLARIPVIGVTGTRGKSTVTHLLHHILKTAKKDVLLGGNVLGVSTLSLLPKNKKGSVALFELDSWQLQGFGDSKLSPNIAVFTTFMDDHLAYYKGSREAYFADKAHIFKYQTKDDVFVIGRQALPSIRKWGGKIISKRVIAPLRVSRFTSKLPGAHNEYNIALAASAARAFGIKDPVIKKAVKSFRGVPGRLELIREIKGVKFYNDTTATTPDATVAALKALGKKKNIILIAGGSDKNLSFETLPKEINRYCKEVLFLSGTGTEKLKQIIKAVEYKTLNEAVLAGYSLAKKGDIILLSPACASFGMFKNEYDRGRQFNIIIKNLRR